MENYNIIDEIRNEMIKKIGNEMHHYTKFENFYKIIDSKQLWIGDTRFMNDKREILPYIELNFNDNNKIKKDIIDYYYKNGVYAFCSSLDYDDYLKWMSYGGNGTGICITFNIQKICKYLGYDFILSIPSYDRNFNKMIDDYNKNIFNDEYHKINIDSAYRTILTSAALFKNNSFESENECRLCTTNNENISFKLVGNIIKRFKVIDLKDSNNIKFEDTIEKITLGPQCKQDIDILSYFLDEKGYSGLIKKITTSKCEIRKD